MTISVSDLSRLTTVEVSADGEEFTPINGKTKWAPKPAEASTEDATTMEDDGWEYPEVTGYKWSAELEVLRKRYADDAESPLVHDPGQELCRAAVGKFGPAAQLYVRYYDTEGLLPAYQGLALVTWEPTESNVKGLSGAKITFTGQGKLRDDVTNPNAVPVVTGATPSNAITGATVTITGSGFTGATAVTFGGTAAGTFTVVSATQITATMPAGGSGSAAIVVTTPAGTSNSFAYTRGGSE